MAYFYVVFAILLRLIPHPWNMTPLGAMFLFSGATLKHKRESLMFPMAALIISDSVVMGLRQGPYYDPRLALFTWLGFIAIGLTGWWLRNRFSSFRLLCASLAGSLLFFLISNLGEWFNGTLYPSTWSGLMECYTMAIPFFRNSLLGDLFYSAIMFGSYHLLRHYSFFKPLVRS